jgi:hypothetical protein
VQPIFECPLRVHACDTDGAGRLKASSVFNHIQNVAAVHAESLGAGIEQILKQGKFWVLSWAKVEFAHFPMFGDEIALCMANGANDGPLHLIEGRKAGTSKPVVQALIEWAPAPAFLPLHKGLLDRAH